MLSGIIDLCQHYSSFYDHAEWNMMIDVGQDQCRNMASPVHSELIY